MYKKRAARAKTYCFYDGRFRRGRCSNPLYMLLDQAPSLSVNPFTTHLASIHREKSPLKVLVKLNSSKSQS